MSQEFFLPFAYCLLRVVTGILFFFQGYDKIVHIKTDGVMNVFGEALNRNRISSRLIRPAITVSSYAELIGGALLAAGFLSGPALIVLGIDLFLVALAFSIIRPMWDMQFFFPRFVFILALMLLPGEYNRFSVDALMR